MRLKTRTTFPLLASLRPSLSVQSPSMTLSPRFPTLATRSISSPQARKFSLPTASPTLPLPVFLVLVWQRESSFPCVLDPESNFRTALTYPASHFYSWDRWASSPPVISPSAFLPLPFPTWSKSSQATPATPSHSTAFKLRCLQCSARIFVLVSFLFLCLVSVCSRSPSYPLLFTCRHFLFFIFPLLSCPSSSTWMFGCNGWEMRIQMFKCGYWLVESFSGFVYKILTMCELYTYNVQRGIGKAGLCSLCANARVHQPITNAFGWTLRRRVVIGSAFPPRSSAPSKTPTSSMHPGVTSGRK